VGSNPTVSAHKKPEDSGFLYIPVCFQFVLFSNRFGQLIPGAGLPNAAMPFPRETQVKQLVTVTHSSLPSTAKDLCVAFSCCMVYIKYANSK
jgi:hypothetical protein